jgi:hypothetical protein
MLEAPGGEQAPGASCDHPTRMGAQRPLDLGADPIARQSLVHGPNWLICVVTRVVLQTSYLATGDLVCNEVGPVLV